MMPIKILIADDHPVFLESLGLLIARIPGFELAGKMRNGQEVLSYLQHSPAGLVLTDIQMPVMNGLDLVIALRRQFPDIRILMLTMLEDTATIKETLKAGASGYIFKSASLAEFGKALNTVAAGSSYYSEEVMQRLLEEEPAREPGGLPGQGSGKPTEGTPERFTGRESRNSRGREPGGLTERELEIVRLIVAGLSTAEIAARLFISVNTVETHRKNIHQKTGVRNVAGLIRYARQYDII